MFNPKTNRKIAAKVEILECFNANDSAISIEFNCLTATTALLRYVNVSKWGLGTAVFLNAMPAMWRGINQCRIIKGIESCKIND